MKGFVPLAAEAGELLAEALSSIDADVVISLTQQFADRFDARRRAASDPSLPWCIPIRYGRVHRGTEIGSTMLRVDVRNVARAVIRVRTGCTARALQVRLRRSPDDSSSRPHRCGQPTAPRIRNRPAELGALSSQGGWRLYRVIVKPRRKYRYGESAGLPETAVQLDFPLSRMTNSDPPTPPQSDRPLASSEAHSTSLTISSFNPWFADPSLGTSEEKIAHRKDPYDLIYPRYQSIYNEPPSFKATHRRNCWCSRARWPDRNLLGGGGVCVHTDERHLLARIDCGERELHLDGRSYDVAIWRPIAVEHDKCRFQPELRPRDRAIGNLQRIRGKLPICERLRERERHHRHSACGMRAC
jgi:hypothetical protein